MIERIYPVILSILITVFFWYHKIDLGALTNYSNIMSSAMSLGSIAVGFLAAAITLIPALSDNELVKNLKRMGVYQKLLKYIIKAIFALFAISLLSIFGLFLKTGHYSVFNKYFYLLWIYTFSYSLLTTYRVINNFLKFLVVTQNEN